MGRQRRLSRLTVLGMGSLLAATSALSLAVTSGAGSASASEVASEGAARVAAVDRPGGRMVDLTVDSPAVGQRKVRILLPTRFDELPEARWPVLLLLHGCCSDHTAWTSSTAVDAMTADRDVLVVMPDGGAWGWYSDWWNDGRGGPPMWETFHVTELIEILERDWRAATQRAVAGASMGGLGAMSYAARHPGLFQASASYSGVLATRASGLRPGRAIWGDPAAQRDVWAAHDPVSLAPRLRDVDLFVSYGDGTHAGTGRLADDVELWATGLLEERLVGGNEAFVAELVELGIPVTVEVGPGVHGWAAWELGLRHSLPLLLGAIGA